MVVGPVRQPYDAIISFILPVRDYELGLRIRFSQKYREFP